MSYKLVWIEEATSHEKVCSKTHLEKIEPLFIQEVSNTDFSHHIPEIKRKGCNSYNNKNHDFNLLDTFR